MDDDRVWAQHFQKILAIVRNISQLFRRRVARTSILVLAEKGNLAIFKCNLRLKTESDPHHYASRLGLVANKFQISVPPYLLWELRTEIFLARCWRRRCPRQHSVASWRRVSTPRTLHWRWVLFRLAPYIKCNDWKFNSFEKLMAIVTRKFLQTFYWILRWKLTNLTFYRNFKILYQVWTCSRPVKSKHIKNLIKSTTRLQNLILANIYLMDHCVFRFATRGQCIKGK